MNLTHSFFNRNSLVDLFLCNTGQLGAELSQLWIMSRLDKRLKGRLYSTRLHINDDNRKLDDLCWVERLILIVSASAFKIKGTYVFKRRLVKIKLPLKVHHCSKVSAWNWSILQTTGEDHLVLRDPKWNLLLTVHSFRHIDVNNNLARWAHSRDHTVTR